MQNELLRDYLESIDNCSTRVLEQFDLYRSLLLEWNQKFNLTAITDPAEIDVKHFIDSLIGLPYISGDVLDIGCGAGFPSIPLKLLMPDNNFTLADSLNKRIVFINEVIDKLSLSNIRAVHARAEDLPKNEKYDTVAARAVAHLATLCEYSLPFLKIGGHLAAYKAFDVEKELNESKNAVSELGGKITDVKKLPLFGTDIIRTVIIIEKVVPTPKKYPRGKNLPRTNPLF